MWLGWGGGATSRGLAILNPKDVFKVVRNGDTTILGTFGDDAFRPKVHGQLRPVVVAAGKLVPVALELSGPRPVVCEKLPEGGEDDSSPVVEIGCPERCDRFNALSELAQFVNKGGLLVDFAAL